MATIQRLRARCRDVLRLAPLLAACAAAPSYAGTCEMLAVSASLSGVTITTAATIPGTAFTAPDGQTYVGLPSFCKVSAVLTPTSDSFINVELWMPTATWTGRFEGVGNGGYAGTMAVAVPAMIAALQSGSAVASTDMGTAPSANNNADTMIGHPQKWIDFGDRATHLMTTAAKQIVRTFYGQSARWSYFNGCSTGGQQALMEAQRYPDDYDGILGGDPAANRTHVHTGVLWNYRAMRATPNSLFTSSQAQLVTNAVLAACTVSSGGVAGDPFLTDPRACSFDPAVLQCSGTNASNCLHADQVHAARLMYDGARNPANGHLIFPGAAKGSESDSQFGWSGIGSGAEVPFGSLFKWTFGPTWLWQSFDFDQGTAAVDALLATHLNANSADLGAFKARGGKLLMYHGWADPLATPQDSIDYFHRIVSAQGGKPADALKKTQAFYRLFMVPGMAHCAFGPGPNAFGNLFSGKVYAPPPPVADADHDARIALQQWVERGIAPTRLVATKFVDDVPNLGIQMTRPLCPFPQVARYSGSGSVNDAASFVCAASPGSDPPMPAPEYQK